jgi:A/G-specific adenine glycosylase
VSELMLQQTQVARVVPRWQAFVEIFPDPRTCAAAPLGAVIGAWAGLGYNRRARNLHACARVVVAEHDGRLPDALPALLALPGIGPYTARAVLAFAYGRRVGVLDTNTVRVLSRWAGHPVTQADADGFVPPGHGWAWNQAVLDLGATVCRPEPACERCPLADDCRWRSAGLGPPDPWVRRPGQAPFEGSDRQGRGRLVAALRRGPVPASGLAAAMGWPTDPGRAERVAATLVSDGLVTRVGDRWSLPS